MGNTQSDKIVAPFSIREGLEKILRQNTGPEALGEGLAHLDQISPNLPRCLLYQVMDFSLRAEFIEKTYPTPKPSFVGSPLIQPDDILAQAVGSTIHASRTPSLTHSQGEVFSGASKPAFSSISHNNKTERNSTLPQPDIFPSSLPETRFVNPRGTAAQFKKGMSTPSLDDEEDLFSTSPSGEYSSKIPEFNLSANSCRGSTASNSADSASKNKPPALPPHLEKVILNAAPLNDDGPGLTSEDSWLLPVPNHVVLNHLYACSIRDGVMAVAGTTRYRNK
ncbi:galactose metabolism- protein, partial [Massospora cicadina]